MPREEYYLYAARTYGLGLMSPQIFLEAIHKIDERSDRVVRSFAQTTGVPELIEQVGPLRPINAYIKETVENSVQSVRQGGAPIPLDFDKALRILRDADPLWAKLIEANPDLTAAPTDRDLARISKDPSVSPEERRQEFELSRWQRLNYVSYVYAMIDVSRFDPERNQLGLAVENPLESKIFINTGKLRQAVGEDIRAAALYVHEQIMPPHNPAQAQLTKSIYYLPDEIDAEHVRVVRGIYGLHD